MYSTFVDTKLVFCQRGQDTYQGFIRVHMNLLRPINVIAGERPLSIFETVGGQKEEDQKVRYAFKINTRIYSRVQLCEISATSLSCVIAII